MSDFSTEIAKAVKFDRKRAGLSQKQLADYAGVGKTVVFDIEHGKATVQLQSLLKVLRVVNIKLVIEDPLHYKESEHEAR
jgi:y4mF family transcriptional regulator